MENGKIKIKSAGRKGRGVFAKKTIKAGEIFEIAPYLVINLREYYKLRDTMLISYVYDVGGNKTAVGLGFASLYNHSVTPNAEYSIQKKSRTLKYKAAETIRAGSEITIDYGYHPAKEETWDKDHAQQKTKKTKKTRAK